MNPKIRLVESQLNGGLVIPLDAADRLAWQTQFNQWPIAQQLDMQLDLSHPVGVCFSLNELRPFHFGGVGDAGCGGGHAVNGAIISSLFDGALGVAGALQLPGRRAGTVDLSIKMFRPVMRLATVFGWAIRRTSSMVFVEAVLFDADNRRCAQASGIVGAADSAPRTTAEHERLLASAG
jgi:acyl-coenzyme A thioesterase PaaI-like protein